MTSTITRGNIRLSYSFLWDCRVIVGVIVREHQQLPESWLWISCGFLWHWRVIVGVIVRLMYIYIYIYIYCVCVCVTRWSVQYMCGRADWWVGGCVGVCLCGGVVFCTRRSILFKTKLKFLSSMFCKVIVARRPLQCCLRNCASPCRLSDPNIEGGAHGHKAEFQFSFAEGGSLTDRI